MSGIFFVDAMNDAIMVSPSVGDMGGRSEEASARDNRGAVRYRRLVSEVEEVEYWVGLREAIQRASEALKGQTGVWEALLMEAGCVLRRRRRPALL